jgi:acetyltransferase-like isoleucine patch superfamily enzyme
METAISPTADVDPSALIGAGCTIWQLAQVREGAVLGEGCVVGRGAYVDAHVRVGRHCKLGNYALVYAPAVLGDGVQVSPGAILTNDRHPRAVNPDGTRKGSGDWEAAGVTVGDGASIGSQAVIVAGVSVGRWALVGAGAVVTRDVPDHALVVGTPARWVGWVGKSGVRLVEDRPGTWRCPADGSVYREQDGRLVAVR